jgi:hypothetical protein
MNMRKGSTGTLYLTMAPRTGVINPMSEYIQRKKEMLNQKIGRLIFPFLLALITQKAIIRRRKIFSTVARRIRGECESKRKGLVSTRIMAPGELIRRLKAFGSIMGI